MAYPETAAYVKALDKKVLNDIEKGLMAMRLLLALICIAAVIKGILFFTHQRYDQLLFWDVG